MSSRLRRRQSPGRAPGLSVHRLVVRVLVGSTDSSVPGARRAAASLRQGPWHAYHAAVKRDHKVSGTECRELPDLDHPRRRLHAALVGRPLASPRDPAARRARHGARARLTWRAGPPVGGAARQVPDLPARPRPHRHQPDAHRPPGAGGARHQAASPRPRFTLTSGPRTGAAAGCREWTHARPWHPGRRPPRRAALSRPHADGQGVPGARGRRAAVAGWDEQGPDADDPALDLRRGGRASAAHAASSRTC